MDSTRLILLLMLMRVDLLLVDGRSSFLPSAASDSLEPAAVNGRIRSSRSSMNGTRRGIRLGLSHKYHANSSLLPDNCDSGCAARVMMDNHSKGRKLTGWWAGYVNDKANMDWYVTVEIGNPPQRVELAIDTGSDFTWLQCEPCELCFSQRGAIFQPATSAGFRYSTESDVYCQDVQSDTGLGTGMDATTCNYEVIYGDLNSFSEGRVVNDVAFFSDQTLYFGCGQKNHIQQNLGIAGVLGLSQSLHGFTLMDQLAGHVESSQFSYCLSEIGDAPDSGFLYLGSDSIPGDPGYWNSDFLQTGEPLYYYVDVIQIYLDGISIGCPDGVFDITPDRKNGIVIDSGTPQTYLIPQVYELLRNAWRNIVEPRVGGQAPYSYGVYETCYTVINPGQFNPPVVSYGFRNGYWFDTTSHIFYKDNGNIGVCFVVVKEQGDYSLIGGLQQRHTLLGFDITEHTSSIGMESQCMLTSFISQESDNIYRICS